MQDEFVSELWEKKKSEEGKEQLVIQNTILCGKHGGDSVMTWASMASNETGSLLFTEDVTADRSIRMNSMVYKDIFAFGQFFRVQVDNDRKHVAKATQDFLKAKK